MAMNRAAKRRNKTIRPIQREVYNSDAWAGMRLAVHQAAGIGTAPQAFPGFLTTQPALAGTQVKNGLNGGYFAPLKNEKFV